MYLLGWQTLLLLGDSKLVHPGCYQPANYQHMFPTNLLDRNSQGTHTWTVFGIEIALFHNAQ